MATRNEEPEKAYYTIESDRFNPSETSQGGLYQPFEPNGFFSSAFLLGCYSTPVLEMLRCSYVDCISGRTARGIVAWTTRSRSSYPILGGVKRHQRFGSTQRVPAERNSTPTFTILGSRGLGPKCHDQEYEGDP